MNERRDLGFGITALRLGRVDPAEFVRAVETWMAEPHRRFSDALADGASLSAEDREAIEREMRLGAAAPDETNPAFTEDGSLGFDLWGAGPPSLGPSSTAEGHARADATGPHRDGVPDFGRRYERAKLHGVGGVGRVWSVWDRTLARQVALKELRPDRARDPAFARRLIAEAEITAGLTHPNIVPVFELSTFSDPPYYTMPLLGGRTLDDEIREFHEGKSPKGFSGEAPLALIDGFLAVANAIAYANQKGVIHRDIKAKNVVIGPFREVIVLDWGLARPPGGPDPLAHMPPDPDPEPEPSPGRSMASTRPGELAGTPNCMAPEQARARNEAVDRRTDVFGLGALLYAILTGGPPYVGPDRAAVLELARACAYPPPRRVRADVPPALEAICMKAMAADPLARYDTAEALAKDVRRWRDDEPVAAYPDGPRALANRWARKNLATVAASFAILLTLLPAVMLYASGIGRERQKALLLVQDAETAFAQERSAKELANADLATVVAMMLNFIRSLSQGLPSLPGSPGEQLRELEAVTACNLALKLANGHQTEANIILPLCDLLVEAAQALENSSRPDHADGAYRRLERIAGRIGVPLDPDPRALDTVPPEVLAHVASFRVSHGMLLLDRDDARAADRKFVRALELCERSLASRPRATASLRTQVNALRGRGMAALLLGDEASAETFLKQAVSRLVAIPAEEGFEANDARHRASAEIEHGRTLVALDRKDEARDAFRRAAGLARDLLTTDPTLNDHIHLDVLARVELALSGGPAAFEALDAALADFARFVADHPQLTQRLVELATARVRAAEGALEARKLDRAARMATEAELDVEALIGRRPDLGIARRSAGRLAVVRTELRIAAGDAAGAEISFKDAREAFARSRKLRPEIPPDPEDETHLARLRAKLDALPAR